MNWINKLLKGDRVIWVVMLLLGIISLIAVYSATSKVAYAKIGGYDEKMLLKHAATLLGGFVMMFLASRFNYRRYSRAIELALLLCFILLIFTSFMGDRSHNASRTLMGFQPSEVAKIVLIIYLAKYISIWSNRNYKFKDLIVPIFLPILLIVGPIFPENLSTAALLGMVCIVMLFIGQIKFGHIMIIIGVAVFGLTLYILADDTVASIRNKRHEKVVAEAQLHPNDSILQKKAMVKPRVSRVKTWQARLKKEETATDTTQHKGIVITDSNRQQVYAEMAVASGGIFGKGSGKSTLRNFLQKPYNDCIYAIIIEEYGLVGGFFVMLLYIILLTRTVMIMKKRPLSFGALMSFGIAFILIMQAMINMGVSTGLFPVTGQQLPFVSKGGTSMLMTGFAVGIILSVTRSLEEAEHETQHAELEAIASETEETPSINNE